MNSSSKKITKDAKSSLPVSFSQGKQLPISYMSFHKCLVRIPAPCLTVSCGKTNGAIGYAGRTEVFPQSLERPALKYKKGSS